MMEEPQKEAANEEQPHHFSSSPADPENPGNPAPADPGNPGNPAPADPGNPGNPAPADPGNPAPADPGNLAPLELASPAAGDPGKAAPVDRPQDEGERTVMGDEDPLELPSAGPANFLPHFKLRKFFVLRPGTLNQAIKDIEALVDKEIDGSIHSIWLMAEVDHWNNEKERLVLITDNSLLLFKYDFVMLRCDQIQRIPLNFVDRITYGAFVFPKGSLLRREGEGLRIFWDRLREPSFTSRWNPFTTDFPYTTFTYHPVKDISDTFTTICNINKFREQLMSAAQKVHAVKPVPGKANGILLLNQNIQIEAYVGLMSFIGNQNKLGYCMARGNIGF